MKNPNTIMVCEHERLLAKGGSCFTKVHLDALIGFNDKHQNKYFTVIRDGIKFSQYVGVIQAGNLTIEILPKADKDSISLKGDKPVWRGVLIDMLSECKLLRMDRIDKAALDLRANSILEIYIQIFLEEVSILLRNGLVKKYQVVEGNKSALKGRWDFAKQLNKNIVHQERFYVHFSEYNNDNIYNRILLKTLKLIPKITSSPAITSMANRILFAFPELADCKADSATFNELHYDRKTVGYKEVLLISKMLLLNYRPDISGGSENVIAVLFDMNKLWEEFIFRRLKKEEVTFGIIVQRQQYTNFWQPQGPTKSKTIRPDIVIQHKNQKIIIDTKWKILIGFIPSDEDLKQMFVYNLYWECAKSFLLYPADRYETGYGNYHKFDKTAHPEYVCGIEKFSILENNQLKKTLGVEILEKVLQMKLS